MTAIPFIVFALLHFQFQLSSGGPQHSVTKTFMEIEKLTAAEIKFAQYLTESLPTLRNQTLAIKYLKVFEAANFNLKGYTHDAEVQNNVKAVNSNPIGIYHMVRRFINELAELKEQLLHSNSTADLLQFFAPDLWFTKTDLDQTVEDMLQICHIYNLNVTNFADGIVQGVKIGSRLSAKDCYDIGRYADTARKPALSVLFLEEAARKTAVDHTANITAIELALNESIKRHDKQVSNKSMEALQRQFQFNRKLGPLRKRYGELYKEYRVSERTILGRLPNTDFKYPNGVRSAIEPEFPPYYELCEQENLQSEDKRKELFCWYETALDPYWRINPLKMEILSKEPELVQIYDIIGRKKRQFLKDKALATGLLNPIGKPRNLETAKFPERDHPEIRSIVLDMEKITGLDLTSPGAAQDIRVASSIPGSNFHTHLDRIPMRGSYADTAATFLYYLEPPELGGATAFVHAGVTISPVEGSAIYFFSTRMNGATYRLTQHGGCPVIFGRKWIATKFINYAPQFLNMKCVEWDETGQDVQPPMFSKSKLLRQRFYSKRDNLKL